MPSTDSKARRAVGVALWCLASLFLAAGLGCAALGVRHILETAVSDRSFVRRTAEMEVLQPRAARWRVGVIGDSRGNDEVFGKALKMMAERQVDVIFFLGDMVPHPSEAMFSHFVAEVAEATVDCPGIGGIYFVPGNHDSDDHTGLALYQKYFGRAYHAIRLGRAIFILINNENKDLDAAQRAWILQKLDQAAAEKLDAYLCMHFPPHGSGVKKDDLKEEASAFIAQAVRSHPAVRMILASHLHGYARGSFAGVPVVVTGGGGAPLDKLPGSEFNFVVLDEEDAAGAAVSYVPIPDPDGSLRVWGRRLFLLESQPAHIYWGGAVLGALPLAVLVIRRRRRARVGEPAAQAAGPKPEP